MKPFLAMIAGFVLSLGMFVFGLVFATSLLTAEPVHQPGPSVDVAELWTEQPRQVNTASQDLERLPALPVARKAAASRVAPAGAEASTVPPVETDDSVVATAVQDTNTEDGEQPVPTAQLSEAHVEWCSRRYRSYRVQDDSYTPYSGGRRPCVSPFSGDVEAAAESLAPSVSVIYADQADEASSPSVEYVSAEASGSSFVSADHAAYCFDRYRSYRPDDNTYQPYGGGPRRECR